MFGFGRRMASQEFAPRYTRANWLNDDPSANQEFIRLINSFADLKPRPLTQKEIELIQAETHRGTDVFFVLLSLYTYGKIVRIKDRTGQNLADTFPIKVGNVLVTPNRNEIVRYTDRYFSHGDNIDTSVLNVEENILRRFLHDNNALPDSFIFPQFLMQPLVLGFEHPGINNPIIHAPFERELPIELATPNRASRDLFESLIGKGSGFLQDNAPILYSRFVQD